MTRVSPSLVVAVLALVVAASGAGYAAGKVTSRQIKDNTVASKDIKNGTIAGVDVKAHSIGRDQLVVRCKAAELTVPGGCINTSASFSAPSYAAAIAGCTAKGGRLPTLDELGAVALTPSATWAGGTGGNMYEYTGSVYGASPMKFLAIDRSGNTFDASMSAAHYHCVTAP